MEPLRVAIVCGVFREGLSYQENVWAEELCKRHVVCVFNAGPTNSAQPVQPAPGVYGLVTLKTTTLPHGIQLCRGLGQKVRGFAPDLILWIGVTHYFGRDLVTARDLRTLPIVSFFGENLGMHEFEVLKPGISLGQRLHALGYRIMRGPICRQALKYSRLIVCCTYQTRPILLRLLPRTQRESVNGKMTEVPLGFSPNHFFWNPERYVQTRTELGVRDSDILACISSRFEPNKLSALRNCTSGLLAAMDRRPNLRGLVIGVNNSRIAAEIQETIRNSPHANRFLFHRFTDRQKLAALYTASDIALFRLASISCQESMGTGVRVCLIDDGSMNHLLREPAQGCLFKNATDLCDQLVQAASALDLPVPERCRLRAAVARSNRWLGYDALIENLMTQIKNIL